MTSGAISPRVAVSGRPAQQRTPGLVNTLAEEYYPPHTRQQVAERELTVDGAPAYLVRYRAVFDPDRAEGDLGQVRGGRGAGGGHRRVPPPSALYVSLPDTVRQLWPSIDGLISSVRILR